MSLELSDHRDFARGFVALAPVYLAPLFATHFLPAFDLPHHLAIVDALTKAHDPSSPYARDFMVHFELVPFVVHLILLRALAAIVPIGVAAKVLVGAVILTLPLATARLLHVARHSTVPALLAFPLAYSMPLHYGLIAFVPAMPLLILMLAEASNETGWQAHPLRTAGVLAVLSLATFCTHLEAWGVGALAAIAALLLTRAPWRTRALGIVSLMPTVATAVFYLARTAADPEYGSRPSVLRALVTARLQEIAARGVFSDLWDRVRVAPVHLLRGFNDGADLVAAYVLFGLILAGIVVRLASRGLRWPRPLPRPTPAAGLVLVAAAAYFGLPHHAPPDAHSVYPRFVVILALTLLLALPARFSDWSRVAASIVAVAVGLLLSVYALVLVHEYAAFGRELADFEEVVRRSPAGLASGGLVFDAESSVMNVEGIFTGVPEYYVLERPAPSSSTWLYYCDVPQLPCRRLRPYEAAPLPHFTYPTGFDPERALRDLQLLFVRGGPPADRIFGREVQKVRLLAESGRWRVFIRR